MRLALEKHPIQTILLGLAWRCFDTRASYNEADSLVIQSRYFLLSIPSVFFLLSMQATPTNRPCWAYVSWAAGSCSVVGMGAQARKGSPPERVFPLDSPPPVDDGD
jgi:hypothetical protein